MLQKIHFLLFLVVFYCVNVGNYIECASQGQDGETGSYKNHVINCILVNLINQKDEFQSVNRKLRRKKCRREKKKNKREGKTVLIISRRRNCECKWSRLFRAKGRDVKQMKRGKTVDIGFFEKIAKILSNFKFFKKVIRHLNKYKLKLRESLRSKGIDYIKDKLIRRLTIRKLLICQTVELNPGPPTNIKDNLLNIVTYNCNGLANIGKLKRIVSKSNKILDKGGIVVLQETHIMTEDRIKTITKHKFLLNQYRSNSAGVITLVSNDFNVVESFKDKAGRQLFTIVEKDETKFLVANVYCPNDHRSSIAFIESVYCKILEYRNIYPDIYVILAGDFNSCMEEKDYLNRQKTKVEVELTNCIRENNRLCKMVDSFRLDNDEPGFTWNRGKCYSRLDYIYVSGELVNKVKSVKIDWAFDKSDHAAVVLKMKIKRSLVKQICSYFRSFYA